MLQETKNKLDSLTPELRLVIIEAVGNFDKCDVYIHETLRSMETQVANVKAGVSRTLKSKHLVQAGGYSHAVDVAFVVDGKLRWDWPLYYLFAAKVRSAARRQGVHVTWGAIWDTPLAKVKGDLEDAHAEYVARFRAKHKRRPLADGPHFQLG